jgi:hypothetical protein
VPLNDSEAFCAIARQQIVNARIKLADAPSPGEEAELWQVVECIEALVKMRAQCFQTELEQIDRELEQRFRNA